MGWAERAAASKRLQAQSALNGQILRGVEGVKDRFGVPIGVGSVVLFRQDDILFEVTAVTPILDPRAPAGVVRVELIAKAALQVSITQPIQGLIALPMRASVDPPPETAPEAPEEPPASDGGPDGVQ